MAPYTKKQRAMLEFLSKSIRQNGIPPTLEEIGNHFKVSRVTAFQHVHALERRGAVRHRPREARSLEILDPAYRPIPFLGTISAGAPIEAVESGESIDLRDFFPARGDYFLLQVRGDSMIDDHIEDGDLVLVERSTSPRDGDTVVAILPGSGVEETTLKRFYREEGGTVRLEPRNRRLKPFRAKDREIEVRGVVRGVLRKY
jgi:repressor LexA